MTIQIDDDLKGPWRSERYYNWTVFDVISIAIYCCSGTRRKDRSENYEDYVRWMRERPDKMLPKERLCDEDG